MNKVVLTRILLALSLTASTPVPAQSFSWASGVSGNWSSPASWNFGSGFPDGAGDTASISIFGQLGNPYDVTLDGNYSVDSFSLTSADASFHASSRTFTVNGGTTCSNGSIILSNTSYVSNGIFSHGSGSFDLVNSTISGTGSYSKGGGTLTMSSGTINGAATQTGGLINVVSSGTFQSGLVNETTIDINNASTLTVNNGTLTNSGTINLLAGTGTVSLTSSSLQTLTNASGGNLVVETGATTSRLIGFSIDNQGAIAANSTTSLNRSGGVHTNSGTITAPAALSTSNAESFTNTSLLTSTGGNFSFDGNGSATSAWDNSGTATAANGITISQFDSITNSGLLDLTGGNASATIGLSGNPGQFTNTGDVEIAPGSNFSFVSGWSGSSITFEPGSTFDGGGAITVTSLPLVLNGAYSPNTSPLTLSSVGVSGTGSLTIANASSLTSSGSTYGIPTTINGTTGFSSTNTLNAGITNGGTFTLANGSTLTVNNSDFTNNSMLELPAGSSSSTITSTAQTLVNTPTGTINLPAGSGNRYFTLSLDNQGQITVDSILRLNRSGGTCVNSATITNSAQLITNNLENFTNTHLLTSTGGNFSFDGNGSTTSSWDNSGTVTAINGITISQFDDITNSGLFDLTGGNASATIGSSGNPGQFTNTGDVEIAPGSNFSFVSGWSGSPITFEPGSTFDGGGTINITSLPLVLNGAYSPNTSPLTLSSVGVSGAGSLTIANGNTLTSSGSTYAVPTTIDGSTGFSSTNTINAAFTNEGTFTLANGSNLTINNADFTNNSMLELPAGNSTTTITSTAQTLVNAPTGTINLPAGSGNRYFTLSLDNQGQITADSILRFNRTSGTYTNSGTITNSAQLFTNNVESFTNTGSLTSTGGNFSFDGNASGTSVFENTGTLSVTNGITILQFEDVTNSGLLDLTGGNASTTVGSSGNAGQFTNTGDVEIAPGSNFSFISGWSGSAITFEPGSTFDGGGAINIASLSLVLKDAWSPNTSPLTFTGSGISGAGSLTIANGSSLTSSGSTYGVPTTINGSTSFSSTNTINAAFTNEGTFTLANGSNLTVNNTDFTNNSVLDFSAGNSTTTITSTAQSLVNTPTGTINLPAGSGNRYFTLSLDNQGQITADSVLRFNRSGGTYTNSGTITNSAQLFTSNVESFTNTGSLTSTGGNFSFDGNSSGTSSFDNPGTLTVTNGITLTQFENATNAGLLDITGGNATITLGVTSNAQQFTNTGDIEVAPGSTFTFNDSWNSTLTLAAGSTLDGGGNLIFNNPTLSLGGAWSPNGSPLTLNSTAVSGTGSLTIASGSSLTSSGSTYGVPTTIDGTASFSSTNTLNDGLTNEAGGAFTLANSSNLILNNADFTNHGLFAITAGTSVTTLTSTARTFVNSPGGTINIPAGTAERRFNLDLDNQGTITTDSSLRLNRSGGTYTNSGTITNAAPVITYNVESFANSGTITSTGGNFSFDGNSSATSSFGNSSTLTVANGLTITQFENVDNSGLIDITGGNATITLGVTSNAQQFTNTGDIEVAPGSTFTFNDSWNSTLTLAAGSTLDGGGNLIFNNPSLSLGGTWSPNTSPLTLNSTVVGGAGSLMIVSGGSLTSTGSTYNTPATNHGVASFTSTNTVNAAFTNEIDGTLTLASNSNLTLGNTDFTNHGLLELAAGTRISTIGSTTRSLVNSPDGTINIPAGTGERRFNLDLDNQGVLNCDSSLRFSLSGSSQMNSGTITNSAQLSSTSIESFENSGTITSTGGNFSFDGNSSATSFFDNSGTLTAANGLTIDDFENTTNSGLIDLTGGNASIKMGVSNNAQQFTNTGQVRIAPGSVFALTNTWLSSASNAAGGRITGSGTFDTTTVTFTNHGIVAPGLSAGTLTVSPNLTNSATAEFEIEVLSAAGPGTGHDQLHITGDLVLDGILKPRLVGGYVPLPSDTFVIIKADGELTGNFAMIDQPESFGTWSVSVDEVNDEVTVSFTQTGALSFADFQDLYFTPQQIANGDADAGNDFDGDGLGNHLEWFFGSNPLVAGPAAAPVDIAHTGGPTIDLTYPESTLLPPALQVGIETNSVLSLVWLPIPPIDFTRLSAVPIPGHPNVNLVTLRITNPSYAAATVRFFRLTFPTGL